MRERERGERKKIGPRKDIEQGSNDGSEAKVAHVEKFAGGRDIDSIKKICGAHPADGGCRDSIGTGVEILVYAETIAVAELVVTVKSLTMVRKNG